VVVQDTHIRMEAVVAGGEFLLDEAPLVFFYKFSKINYFDLKKKKKRF
jgi:hypothetical protein